MRINIWIIVAVLLALLATTRSCNISMKRNASVRMTRAPRCAGGELRASLLGAAGRPPVIREKSQFRAQHDSLSLSPAHDGTSLYLNFRALAALLLWAAYFSPQHPRRANECGTLPQSSSSSRLRVKRAPAHSESIANWFSISGYADRPSKGGSSKGPRPVGWVRRARDLSGRQAQMTD
jgi:hypothetical protein